MTDNTALPKVTIYSDGGCSPNPGFGSWAALLMFKHDSGEMAEKTISGFNANTTNNQMELTAAIEALESLKMPCEVMFYTDSEYLKNGITKWMKGWIKNGWRTSAHQPDGKGGVNIVPTRPVQNQDLWQRLNKAIQRHKIAWHWVKGHAKDENNNRVDRLVTQTREDARRNYQP
ncbi:MAG: ribonuclease HI [bacterium]|nr:ribonuclease HI [bacterium]